MMLMNAIPLVLYVVTAGLYVVQFSGRNSMASRAASASLVAAAMVHTFVMGMATMQAGHVPVAGATQAISSFVWLLALSYLYLEMTTRERSMGVFILPLLAALQIIPTVHRAAEKTSPLLQGIWFNIHVPSILFAYASFALACVISITYMLLFNEIKAKHLGFFYARLPSLQSLDDMNLRAVKVGWVFLTVGVIAGVIWVLQARVQDAGDPRIQAMSLEDPKIFVALLCWLVYSFELYAQRAIGWRGTRAAWLSAVGFVIVLLNFLPVSYFFTKSHTF
jgi:ABC-type transport system involved in cytochrome c biogenesis permease subunit